MDKSGKRSLAPRSRSADKNDLNKSGRQLMLVSGTKQASRRLPLSFRHRKSVASLRIAVALLAASAVFLAWNFHLLHSRVLEEYSGKGLTPARANERSSAEKDTTPLKHAVAGNATQEINSVVVLGSGGVLGLALTEALEKRGYHVVKISGPTYLDLRHPNAVDQFSSRNVVALIVIIDDYRHTGFTGDQEKISRDNYGFMVKNVYKWTKDHGVKLLFTSSYWPEFTGTRREARFLHSREIDAQKFGKVVRIPSILGDSLMTSDFLREAADTCEKTSSFEVKYVGKVRWIGAHDAAHALVDLVEDNSIKQDSVEILNEEFISLKKLLLTFVKRLAIRCDLKFPDFSSPLDMVTSGALLTTGKSIGVSSDMISMVENLPMNPPDVETGNSPYISVILSGHNDNYMGTFFVRLFNFLRTFSTAANKYGLRYEILFVQYNPREDLLPISHVLPWTSVNGFGNLKVITIPKRIGSKQHFLEFYPKNYAARRSTGEYILFTNSDNVFSHVLIEELAKEQLNPRAIYRANRLEIDLAPVDTDVQTILQDCHKLAPTDFTDFIKQNTNIRLNKPFWKACGDFTLLSRQRLFDRRGYPEIDSSLHVDSLGLKNFFCPSYPETFQIVLDEPICHQSHEKRRPKSVKFEEVFFINCTSDFDEQLEIWKHFNISENWGGPEVSSNLADLGSFFTGGFNPVSKYASIEHHPVFRKWEEVLWVGNHSSTVIRDFLGNSYDAEDVCGSATDEETPRKWRCERHKVISAMQVPTVLADLPMMDEEYFPWIGVLTSASSYLASDFVVIEVGSHSGLWGLRAVTARNRLIPSPSRKPTVTLVQTKDAEAAKAAYSRSEVAQFLQFNDKFDFPEKRTNSLLIINANVGMALTNDSIALNPAVLASACNVVVLYDHDYTRKLAETILDPKTKEVFNYAPGVHDTDFGRTAFLRGVAYLENPC